MDINEIYTKIFPLGGIDDNNSYTELTGDQIGCIQLIEPALGVTEVNVTKKERYDKDNQPDKYAYRIPIIYIDDIKIEQLNLTAFKLDYSGFIPTVMVEFVDFSNVMLSTGVIKDGSVIKVYIGGNGDELFYKPIRQDFVITSVKRTGGGDQNIGDYFRYRLYGKLNVPYGYRKETWSQGECTAMQELFNICVYTGLGFSTNFTKTNTLDKMKWLNNENGTYFDFIEDITAHACYSPNTFFTSFIDQFNCLNFVECHSLLSHGGKKTDVPAMMYNNYLPSEIPEKKEGESKTTRNQLPLRDDDDEMMNSYQKLSYYYISNNEFYNGWSNYIEEYIEINNGYSSLSDGYKKHVCYSDSNVDEGDPWDFSVCEFNIRPIDNLKRNPSTQVIEALPEEPTQSSYIPLNLMQMTKKDYVRDITDIDSMTNVESHVSFGEVDTTNMFRQYFFSEVQNQYQMKCLKKCGLKVVLQNYNPAITKFSRIWVDIYDKNLLSNSEITRREILEREKNTIFEEYKQVKNDNILKFEDEGVIDSISDESRKNKNWPRGEFNRSLSGWYVVTEMEIFFNPDDNNLKMKLILNRIEYQPCFKDEYNVAKKAVDKYRNDNVIEDLIINKEQTGK